HAVLCSAASSYLVFTTAASPSAIYSLSLHDALPISPRLRGQGISAAALAGMIVQVQRRIAPVVTLYVNAHNDPARRLDERVGFRSEEHTSELQSRFDLVCRLLLEKKNNHETSKRETP